MAAELRARVDGVRGRAPIVRTPKFATEIREVTRKEANTLTEARAGCLLHRVLSAAHSGIS